MKVKANKTSSIHLYMHASTTKLNWTILREYMLMVRIHFSRNNKKVSRNYEKNFS